MLSGLELRFLGDRLHPDCLQSGLRELLAQPLGILQLEGQWKRIHRGAFERRDDGLDGAHEEAEEFDLVGVAVHIHQHTPPGLVTRAILLIPRGMSGKSMTPNCDPATSKVLSSSSRAWPSMIRVSTLSPSLRARASRCPSMTGDMSVASTCAPRRAAGILRAPLPAATSRNRMPERRSARRRPSFANHMCVGVTNWS